MHNLFYLSRKKQAKMSANSADDLCSGIGLLSLIQQLIFLLCYKSVYYICRRVVIGIPRPTGVAMQWLAVNDRHICSGSTLL